LWSFVILKRSGLTYVSAMLKSDVAQSMLFNRPLFSFTWCHWKDEVYSNAKIPFEKSLWLNIQASNTSIFHLPVQRY